MADGAPRAPLDRNSNGLVGASSALHRRSRVACQCLPWTRNAASVDMEAGSSSLPSATVNPVAIRSSIRSCRKIPIALIDPTSLLPFGSSTAIPVLGLRVSRGALVSIHQDHRHPVSFGWLLVSALDRSVHEHDSNAVCHMGRRGVALPFPCHLPK
jgi:hypothetical protein